MTPFVSGFTDELMKLGNLNSALLSIIKENPAIATEGAKAAGSAAGEKAVDEAAIPAASTVAGGLAGKALTGGGRGAALGALLGLGGALAYKNKDELKKRLG